MNTEPIEQSFGAAFLRALAREYPNRDAVLSALATARAALTLPKGTIHVISDVHGEAEKLKHVVNNGSGGLRVLASEMFGDRLGQIELAELLNFIYYPRESWAAGGWRDAPTDKRREFVRRMVRLEFELLRELVQRYDFSSFHQFLSPSHAGLFQEWIFAPQLGRTDDFLDATLDEFLARRAEVELLRWVARAIRNAFVSELIVAGDFGDRGPRLDAVISYVMQQPNVAITWGNHDASWMGACLGQPACIATVLRLSVRYRRLAQLEQGYGIPLAPLEELARTIYDDDPAELFRTERSGSRDDGLLRRMEKAAAILQFKLEAQTIARRPEFQLDHRDLLRRIDPTRGTVEIDGVCYLLGDRHFPTIDWSAPTRLSDEEEQCLAALQESFLRSPVLWQQMRYLVQHGAMWLRRDQTLIFHGCVPVDRAGEFLSMEVAGKTCRGRQLFCALEAEVRCAFREHDPYSLDLLWYLWAGPLSPLFGKDKITTFESYFIADPAARLETKNAYFHLLHDKEFCRRILREFGVAPEAGLIVNGHVPVRIEAGESPLKASGQAVTIDGAFSEVYGDHGYTLVLESGRTYLAQLHHFASVADSIHHCADIVPTIQVLQKFEPPRKVADTERGAELRDEIAALEALLRAYDSNELLEVGAD